MNSSYLQLTNTRILGDFSRLVLYRKTQIILHSVAKCGTSLFRNAVLFMSYTYGCHKYGVVDILKIPLNILAIFFVVLLLLKNLVIFSNDWQVHSWFAMNK